MPKRFSLLAALFCVAATAGALLIPAVASAGVVETGQPKTPLTAPACPRNTPAANCNIVLERTTAIQSKSDGVLNPTKIKSDGWIVAFTVGISRLSSDNKTVHKLLHGLDASYGGTP